MKIKKLNPMAAFFLVAFPASAINKCVTPSGEVVFTDTACPDDTLRKQQFEYQSPPPAGLRPGEQGC